MDNLKYYNDSLAYDFEMFMPRVAEPAKKDNIVKLPQSKQQRYAKNRAVKRVSASAFAVMTTVFVLAAMCGNIFLRLQINEVNSQINDVRAQIAEVDSEKTELEMEMQRRISYSNLELEAVQLGMKKPEKENVVYIRVNDKDAAQTADGTFVVSE